MQDYLNEKEQWFDWRDASPLIERTGQGLDNVRGLLRNTKPGTWAHKHWTEQEALMSNRWRAQVALHQTGLKQTVVKKVNEHIDYNWWENSEETPDFIGFTALENFVSEKLGSLVGSTTLYERLNESWERAKELRNTKIRQGLL
jgi:hypothetical protein